MDQDAVSCEGTVGITGTSPEGPFSAAILKTTVSTEKLGCPRGVEFIVGDGTGAELLFVVPPSPADLSSIPLGERSVRADFIGLPRGSSTLRATTVARVNVTAADSPPFALCERAASIWPNTGAIVLTVTLAQDGFAMAGDISAPYCLCLECDH